MRLMRRRPPRTYGDLHPDVPCRACPGILAVFQDGTQHHIGACTP